MSELGSGIISNLNFVWMDKNNSNQICFESVEEYNLISHLQYISWLCYSCSHSIDISVLSFLEGKEKLSRENRVN